MRGMTLIEFLIVMTITFIVIGVGIQTCNQGNSVPYGTRVFYPDPNTICVQTISGRISCTPRK